jgi:glycosyltransferase involved in cell wall biosynthesis
MIEKTERPLKIAMLGTRGIPARYGGFETCVEEVGKRLVEMGHDVTVYCRTRYYPEQPEKAFGMSLVYLPSIRKKSLETLSHTFLTILHTALHRYDVNMVFNAANAPLLAPLRLLGRRIAVNTDGLEWKRSKWGRFGRTYYKFSERAACLFANRLVSDCEGIRSYYLDAYGVDSSVIAYGAYCQTSKNPVHLERYGIEPGGYFLQITRFEPDNNPLLTLRAFKRLKTDKKLVLLGGAPFVSEYVQAIEREGGDNVILPGFCYDQELLRDIWCNCYAYVHGNEVGGTNRPYFRPWPAATT